VQKSENHFEARSLFMQNIPIFAVLITNPRHGAACCGLVDNAK